MNEGLVYERGQKTTRTTARWYWTISKNRGERDDRENNPGSSYNNDDLRSSIARVKSDSMYLVYLWRSHHHRQIWPSNATWSDCCPNIVFDSDSCWRNSSIHHLSASLSSISFVQSDRLMVSTTEIFFDFPNASRMSNDKVNIRFSLYRKGSVEWR